MKLGQPLDTKTSLDGRDFLGGIFAIFRPKVGEILNLRFKIGLHRQGPIHTWSITSPVHTHASGTCPHSFGWSTTFK